jgi:putative transposase
MPMSKAKTTFGSFDATTEIAVTYGDLPHWFQPGVAIFVTFRTADSMPAAVIARWRSELEMFLQSRDLPVSLAGRVTNQERIDGGTLGELNEVQRKEFQRLRDRLWHRSLDECHGECLLRDPDLASIVGNAIRHFDREKYDLDRFVVMPNHVHAIVQFRCGYSLEVISQSWLRYTARQINRKLSRSQEFWQGEPFDHLIRSPEQFEYLQRYIVENPQKARLRKGAYMYWQRG